MMGARSPLLGEGGGGGGGLMISTEAKYPTNMGSLDSTCNLLRAPEDNLG